MEPDLSRIDIEKQGGGVRSERGGIALDPSGRLFPGIERTRHAFTLMGGGTKDGGVADKECVRIPHHDESTATERAVGIEAHQVACPTRRGWGTLGRFTGREIGWDRYHDRTATADQQETETHVDTL